MQLTNRSKVVSNEEMTFAEKIYFPAIIGGMAITFRHQFKTAATLKYPEQIRERSSVYRGHHVLSVTKTEQNVARLVVCAQ